MATVLFVKRMDKAFEAGSIHDVPITRMLTSKGATSAFVNQATPASTWMSEACTLNSPRS
jgi:hypothetical protein